MANLIRRNQEQTPSVWEPFRLLRDMMSWAPFAEMLPSMNMREMVLSPSFEVKETSDSYFLKADLPGMKEEDLEVTVAENRVTVTGQREAEQREEGDHSTFTSGRTAASARRPRSGRRRVGGLDRRHGGG